MNSAVVLADGVFMAHPQKERDALYLGLQTDRITLR